MGHKDISRSIQLLIQDSFISFDDKVKLARVEATMNLAWEALQLAIKHHIEKDDIELTVKYQEMYKKAREEAVNAMTSALQLK